MVNLLSVTNSGRSPNYHLLGSLTLECIYAISVKYILQKLYNPFINYIISTKLKTMNLQPKNDIFVKSIKEANQRMANDKNLGLTFLKSYLILMMERNESIPPPKGKIKTNTSRIKSPKGKLVT
ncbi:MAG: hypothetical protein IPO92_21815 [Saprospiraceae bacterium]|nr:hypothetical protein [Saprospiraceae bacterium]